MRVNVNELKNRNEKSDKKIVSKWFETKYVAGGQRDIEFLNFFMKKIRVLLINMKRTNFFI